MSIESGSSTFVTNFGEIESVFILNFYSIRGGIRHSVAIEGSRKTSFCA